jgi:heptosyltransferase-3
MHILFVTATWIGDAILSTGLLAHFIDRYPDARITVAAGPAVILLFRPMPRLQRIIVMRKRHGSMHWPALWIRCVRRRWDLIVDLHRSAIAWSLPTNAPLAGAGKQT